MPKPTNRKGKKMKSKCDKCGEIVSDLDAGFSPGHLKMEHGGCGGTWRAIPDDTPPNTDGMRYAEETRLAQEEEGEDCD